MMGIRNLKEYFDSLRSEGVDVAKALEEYVYSNNPFYRYIGFKIDEFRDGYFSGSFPYKKEICRVGGSIHGGVVMTAIDHAGGMAALSVNEGINQVTVELKVNFLRPLIKGPFKMVGEVIKKGRKVVVAEGKIYDADGNLCAIGIGTWYIIYEENKEDR
jgi:uncharacterized protein (TIGR00369 family)